MRRSSTVKNLYDQVFKTFTLPGIYGRALGEPETNGFWIIQGAEKNGKTWFALMLSAVLQTITRVWYISGEEGKSKSFVDAVKRARIDPQTHRNILFDGYIPLQVIRERLPKRKAPKVVVIDNTTRYKDELSFKALVALTDDFPNVLFIFLAHEEKGELVGTPAKNVRRWAKVIFQVTGLTATVSGRCPGGKIAVDEQKAQLYWGTEITEADETL
jgi:hypothetical protein